jgi:hypothetical protein
LPDTWVRSTRRRLHSGRFKSPVHTATTDVQRGRDVGHRAVGFEEFTVSSAFGLRHVAILSLRLRDALALTLKHHFAFELAKPEKMVSG